MSYVDRKTHWRTTIQNTCLRACVSRKSYIICETILVVLVNNTSSWFFRSGWHPLLVTLSDSYCPEHIKQRNGDSAPISATYPELFCNKLMAIKINTALWVTDDNTVFFIPFVSVTSVAIPPSLQPMAESFKYSIISGRFDEHWFFFC